MARGERDSDELRRVATALERMDELIGDILALARTGTTMGEVEGVDLEAVVKDAWKTTGTGTSTLDIEGLLGTVRGDESRIRELFENLFRNAVEHGSTNSRSETDDAVHGAPDERSVTVTVGRLADGDGFYVADDGPGIPESERESVFEAGYSTSEDGTGFGLNIVRGIADAHGWRVAVTESADGARASSSKPPNPVRTPGASELGQRGVRPTPSASSSCERSASSWLPSTC